MLAKRIIPCLDVDNGRVVKGVQFVDIKDAGDPVEVAKRYNEQGADEITFLDITATNDERDTTYHTVERMAETVFVPLTVGGGVRKIADIRNLLNAGADKVAINSAAVFTPEFVGEAAQKFGNQCIVVAIDAKRVADITVDGVSVPRWEISPTVVVSQPVLMPLLGQVKWRRLALVNYWSPQWMVTAPKKAMTWHL